MRRGTIIALGFVLLVLAVMAAKSALISVPPLREHNAPGEFDAGRAKARLAAVLGDQRPHAADSEGNDLVRARLVGGACDGIGLDPIVRDQVVCNDFQRARLVACARVRNVIADAWAADGQGAPLERALR